jgi:hypothetical protein
MDEEIRYAPAVICPRGCRVLVKNAYCTLSVDVRAVGFD